MLFLVFSQPTGSLLTTPAPGAAGIICCHLAMFHFEIFCFSVPDPGGALAKFRLSSALNTFTICSIVRDSGTSRIQGLGYCLEICSVAYF